MLHLCRLRTLLASLLLLLAAQSIVHAADIFGYVDERGVAHFAAEQLDARYQLFFRGGQSFDTDDGLALPGQRRHGALGEPAVPPASQTLLALFEASPSYRPAKAALQAASKRNDIDYELLQALVATESGFDARAVSPKGALGLMQLMPDTAQRYGVRADRRGSLESKLFDPGTNIATGARHLRDLIVLFKGELELALAAYNAGAGAVQRAGNRIPNYRETQNYVKTVLQLYAYLKPGARTGGKAPGRVQMELAGPRGGALGRGNMPSSQPLRLPALPMPTDPAPAAAAPTTE